MLTISKMLRFKFYHPFIIVLLTILKSVIELPNFFLGNTQ